MFGKRLRFLALCSVSIIADTLCRFAIYLKTALCRAAPLTSRPSTSFRYCERVRFKGQRTQLQVGVRRLLANACVFPCNALFVIASGNQGTPRDTVYPWGKGAHKQKSEHCRPRQCDFKSAVCAANYLKSLSIDADR